MQMKDFVMQLAERVIKSVERIDKQLEPVALRLDRLEAQAKNLAYVGTWKAGDTYHRGNFVTEGGCLWHCNKNYAKTKPGTSAGEWTLAVRKGRDGRDR